MSAENARVNFAGVAKVQELTFLEWQRARVNSPGVAKVQELTLVEWQKSKS